MERPHATDDVRERALAGTRRRGAGEPGPAVAQGHLTQVLAPSLRPGQMVVLDNLSVQKSAVARLAIEQAGCRVRFLPTYSSDFNPVEQAFSKLKQLLRRPCARTVEEVWAATATAYPQITAQDAPGYYRHAGYFL